MGNGELQRFVTSIELLTNLSAVEKLFTVRFEFIEEIRGCVSDDLEGTLRSAVVIAVRQGK